MAEEKKEKPESHRMEEIQIKLIKKDDVLKEPIFKGDNQVNPKINSKLF